MTNRFVIDTNVLISALLFKNSIPFRAIALAEKQGIILYSEATLNELEQVVKSLNCPRNPVSYIDFQFREGWVKSLE